MLINLSRRKLLHVSFYAHALLSFLGLCISNTSNSTGAFVTIGLSFVWMIMFPYKTLKTLLCPVCSSLLLRCPLLFCMLIIWLVMLVHSVVLLSVILHLWVTLGLIVQTLQTYSHHGVVNEYTELECALLEY